MKVVVIGCTHAGTAAIVNIKKIHPYAEITVYERNDNISFLSCGIALWVGGVVKEPEGLFYSSPEKLAELGVKTRMGHDVLALDVNAKTLKVRDLATGAEKDDRFDKLVLTTGSWPIIPPFEGKDLAGIHLGKNYSHAKGIIEAAKKAKKIAVIGAGYIGVELAEAFCELGKEVALVDSQERILFRYLDKAFTEIAEDELREHGVKIATGQRVLRFEGEAGQVARVVTDKETIDADMVVLCVGFRPQTELVKGQVAMTRAGAIIVDDFMRTTAQDVFAAGDSCAVKFNPTGTPEYIPLATNAVRMGMLVARNLEKPMVQYRGTQGTSGIKIFSQNIASTGLTLEMANHYGIEVDAATVVDNIRPEFMPTHEPFRLTVIYRKHDHIIVGAQIISRADLTQSMNTISVCIQAKMTMEDLAFTDFFFQPHYNKPWNWLNAAGHKVIAG